MAYNKNRANNVGAGQSKSATMIAIVISVFTIATIVLGLVTNNPYWIIAGIVPAALYEAWRTEGYYTKTASIVIVVLVLLEILAIMGLIRFNLASYFNTSTMYFGGYVMPLGDIISIFPIIAVLLSILLVRRTYGPYTKWLAILLIASSVVLLYVVNRSVLPDLIRSGASSFWIY